MIEFFTTDLYDCAVRVAGFGTNVVVVLFGRSSQMEFLGFGDRYNTTGGTGCDVSSKFSAATLALIVLSTGIPPLISGYIWNYLKLDIIVGSVSFSLYKCAVNLSSLLIA